MNVMASNHTSAGATTFDSLRPLMIKLVVREVAEKEGIGNPLELSKRTGLPYGLAAGPGMMTHRKSG